MTRLYDESPRLTALRRKTLVSCLQFLSAPLIHAALPDTHLCGGPVAVPHRAPMTGANGPPRRGSPSSGRYSYGGSWTVKTGEMP